MRFDKINQKNNEVKLSEVAELITRGITPSYTEENGVIVINQKCIRDNRVNLELARLTNPEKRKITEIKFLRDYDVLINSTGVGTLGRVAQIKEVTEPMTVDSHVTIVRGNEKIDLKYLGYNLFMQQRNIEHLAEGSTGQTELSRVRLGEAIKVSLPLIPEQKAIANILSSLDDKIEVNNAINKKLEEMAQAIFKQWFVDFEFPNEEGKPYKSSGGAMVESELGMIPEGWEVGTINDIGVVTGGGTPSKKREDYYTDRGIPWITPKDLSINKNRYIKNGVIDITDEGLKNSSAKLMPKGTVLFSSRAPIGYMAIASNPLSTNQGFKSIVPYPEYGTEFVYQLLSINKNIIENHASGSTFKEISGGVLKQIKVLLPSKCLIAKFNSLSESFGLVIQNNEESITRLTTIRDTLLPKLMSGEIRVPVEKE